MIILRHEELQAEIDAGRLVSQADQERIQAASYDLRVGTIFRDGEIVNADHVERDRAFQIQPGELVSIFTLEEVNLPANIAGFAFAMNRLSSQGLLVLNPGHVDPGYRGPLTVKALNLRKTPITVSRRDPIFTIIFFDIGGHTTHPYPGNQPNRRTRETDFNALEQERTPKSIADLLRASKDLPTVSRDQMDRAIREHWMSRLILFFTAVAAITGLILIYLAITPPRGQPAQSSTPQSPASPAVTQAPDSK